VDEENKKGRVTLMDGSTHAVSGDPHYDTIKSMCFKPSPTEPPESGVLDAMRGKHSP
jgi:hypothetical protein